MEQSRRQHVYSGAAIATLAAGVAAEAVRLVAPWRGFVATASEVVSASLMLLWSATAIVLPLRQRSPRLATISRLLAVAAAFAMLAHSAVTRVGGSYVGLVYFAGAGLLTYLFVKIFSRERDPETRAWSPGAREAPAAPPSTHR